MVSILAQDIPHDVVHSLRVDHKEGILHDLLYSPEYYYVLANFLVVELEYKRMSLLHSSLHQSQFRAARASTSWLICSLTRLTLALIASCASP